LKLRRSTSVSMPIMDHT